MNADDLAEECAMWCTFFEYRYYDEERGICLERASEEERTAYAVNCFCGLIDGDGLAAVLSQPERELNFMFRSLKRLELVALLENSERAAATFKESGLRPSNLTDRSAISQLLRPFEEIYFNRLRKKTYARLRRFIHSSSAFASYAANVRRCEKEGMDCYDPRSWR